MKKVRLLAAVLAAALLATSFSGCSNPGTTSSTVNSSASTSSAPTEITYAFCTFTNVPSDVTSVEDAINKITEKSINVKVKLKVYSVANYSQQMALLLSSGQDLDVFHTLGDLNQYAAKNQVMTLDTLLDKYGQGIKSTVPDFFLKAGVYNGKTYGVPFYAGKALAETLIYRKDMLKSVGVSPDSIKTVQDLDSVYAKIKAKYPTIVPLAPINQGDCGLLYNISDVDYLTDSFVALTGVLVGDSTKVVNYYETDQFKQMIDLARDWYKKGYIMKDAATSTSLAAQQISAGTAFSFIGGYAGNEPYTQMTAPAGGELGSIRLSPTSISTSIVNTLTRVISATSKNPEAAMKFMNLTYTDKNIMNLLAYGIEGRDYVKADADHVTYPTGKNAMTVPYNASLSCSVSNMFGPYQLAGQSSKDAQLQQDDNKSAWRSKAFGFTFDSTSVKSQYSSVNNVINQYLPGLRCGSLDPTTELPKFLNALKAAGIDDIIKAKQTQLDNWLKQQK